MKFLVYLKNNWKKAAFCFGTLVYSSHYAHNKYEIHSSMRHFCKEAAMYGEMKGQPKKILVIINPAANNRKSEKNYKDFCEPILHLAGFIVDVLRTETEGHAKAYIESVINLPDGIVIAGGDGTVAEAVTGLMRRNSGRCPVAILPLGNEYKIARKYFNMNPENHAAYINGLASAALAIVRGKIIEKDVIRIIPMGDENANAPKPIYALDSIEWGAFRDSISLKEKYWYFGFLKKYASVIFNAFNKDLSWICKADICYTPSCAGCRNCLVNQDSSNKQKTIRWLSFITGLRKENNVIDNSKLTNENCSNKTSTKIESSNIYISTVREDDVSKLVLRLNQHLEYGFNFLIKSLQKIWYNEEESENNIESRSMTIIPDDISTGNNKFFFIDGESYDVKPLNICVVSKALKVYADVN